MTEVIYESYNPEGHPLRLCSAPPSRTRRVASESPRVLAATRPRTRAKLQTAPQSSSEDEELRGPQTPAAEDALEALRQREVVVARELRKERLSYMQLEKMHRPQEPDNFKGGNVNATKEFIRVCDGVFTIQPYTFSTELDRYYYASTRLRGTVATNWESWVRHHGPEVKQWTLLQQWLMDQVQDPINRSLTYAMRWHAATQRVGQRVQEFSTFLENLELEIDQEPLTEKQQCNALISKIREDLRLELMRQQALPATRNELVSLLQRLEETLPAYRGHGAPTASGKPQGKDNNKKNESTPLASRGRPEPKHPCFGHANSAKPEGRRGHGATTAPATNANSTPITRGGTNGCFNCVREGVRATRRLFLDASAEQGTKGVKLRGLVDSGASFNFVARHVVVAQRWECQSDGIRRARTFLGSEIACQGTVTLDIEVEDHCGVSRSTRLRYHCVDTREYDLVLGTSWLAVASPTIDWRDNTIVWGEQHELLQHVGAEEFLRELTEEGKGFVAFLAATVDEDDTTAPSRIETDASDFALSGILVQQGGEDHPRGRHWHPVAYFSRKIHGAELRYQTHDKELLAIVESTRHWRQYVLSTQGPVRVITDHDTLKYFMTTKKLSPRQGRYAEELAQYDLEIMYRPGEQNPADGLSRRPDYKGDEDENSAMLPALQSMMRAVDNAPVTARLDAVGSPEIITPSLGQQGTDKVSVVNNRDGETSSVGDGEAPSTSEDDAGWATSSNPENTSEYLDVGDPYSETTASLLQSIVDAQRKDASASQEIQRLKGVKDPSSDQSLWSLSGGVLHRKGKLYVPPSDTTATRRLIREIMVRNHDDPSAGHYGIDKTPRAPSDEVVAQRGESTDGNLINPEAEERTRKIGAMRDALASNLRHAVEYQAKHYNAKHQPRGFDVGEKVLLSTRNLASTRPSKKFAARFVGPFQVTEKIGLQAYRLQLTKSMSRIHPVFHVSLLEPYQGGKDTEPPPEEIDGHEEYEVEAIVDKGFDQDGTVKYLTKWKGYGHEHNSWEPAAHLRHAAEALAQFEKDHTPKVGRPQSKRNSRKKTKR
nr:transposon tf2-11 polyprotein [Quercus suber]